MEQESKSKVKVGMLSYLPCSLFFQRTLVSGLPVTLKLEPENHLHGNCPKFVIFATENITCVSF